MSTDIETRLRAALRAAEQAITVDDPAPDAELLHRPAALRHRGAWWGLAAAAAVVIAVAALALGLRSSRSTAPPTSSGTHTAPAPLVNVGPQAKSCDVRLPAEWRRAITAGRVQGFLRLRAVDTDGNAYAVQTLGSTSQLVQIRPDRSIRPIYRAPAGSRIDDASVDGGWVVMGLIVGLPGSDGTKALGRPSGIVAIRIGARDAVMIRHGSPANATLMQAPVILRGTVYWSDGSSVGAVRAYDLATHEQRVLDTGLVWWPFVTGGGVYWFKGKFDHPTLHTERAGSFPRGYSVMAAALAGGGLLESDGNHAWPDLVAAKRVLRVSQAGRAAVTVVRAANSDQGLVADALSGNFLFYGDDAHLRVLDWVTGAAAALPASPVYGMALAGNGELALQTDNGAISMIAAADLPALHC